MKQRVLVLGSGEFLGKRVVAELAHSDWATPIADHAPAEADANVQLIPRLWRRAPAGRVARWRHCRRQLCGRRTENHRGRGSRLV
jgi:hypothetical protein